MSIKLAAIARNDLDPFGQWCATQTATVRQARCNAALTVPYSLHACPGGDATAALQRDADSTLFVKFSRHGASTIQSNMPRVVSQFGFSLVTKEWSALGTSALRRWAHDDCDPIALHTSEEVLLKHSTGHVRQ